MNFPKIYLSINLTDATIQQEVSSLTQDKIKKRRFNIREVLNEQQSVHLTKCMKDVAEFIFQLCEQRGFAAIEVSQEWIAKKMTYCRQTVNLSLQVLEKIGLVKIHRRGYHCTHQYQFRVPDWLRVVMKRVPQFLKKNHLFNKQVSGFMKQSNVDLSSYKEYTEYRDSSEERLRIFRQNNPEKAAALEKKSTIPDVWHASFETRIPRTPNKASPEFAKSFMKSIRCMLHGF